MNESRSDSGSVVLDKMLWVTGGIGGHKNETLSSTEFVYLNKTVKPGPKLPHEIRSHCMASHEHYVFIIGGMISGSGLAKKEVLQYEGNNIWKNPTNRPSMHTGRRDLACTIFKSSKKRGRYLLIVAGGTSDSTHAEYLDFTNSNAKWVWTSKSCFSVSVFYHYYIVVGFKIMFQPIAIKP